MSGSSLESRSRSSRGWSAALRSGIAPWILTWTAIGFAGLALAFLSGCGRTVLVTEGSPLRIGPDAAARVYSRQDGAWVLSESRVALPEGWYLVPPSFVEEP